jgi:DNA mismatch endonuclease (patch repair protein)
MQAIKRSDTKIEISVRRQLHRVGLRYRVDFAPLNKRRRADIVFTRRRVAVFIDGCFWHGCPDHYLAPKSNVEYWSAKIARNVSRDVETTLALSEVHWTVLRFWEHEGAEKIARAIEREVQSRL